ncbi:CSN-associated deubiquitinating enzyme Ubp12 [Myotisia sp. PD_48]|nr:CSN-associated deubiquitinating enzyme Ubp12 [Myotisia sp. PD_48]
MWNDEDNNPYGALDQSEAPAMTDSFHPAAMAPPPYQTPTSRSSSRSSTRDIPDFVTRTDTPSVDDDEGIHPASDGYSGHQQSNSFRRKKGSYDSRIEQILYENPELPILITHAGKNHETGGGFIVYTIRTGDLEVRRRYSEFSSLRATLVSLHPTLIIPPIPEKHSMADYAAKPTKAKEDTSIIELRKRMLAVFLNRCRRMDDILEDGVWWRFLDPNASWTEVLHSHPAASVPKNYLKAPPLDPANPTPGHNWLPVPSSSAKLKANSTDAAHSASVGGTIPAFLHRFPPTSRNLSEEDLDPYFINFEASTRELELLLQGNVEKVNRRTLTHLSTLASDLMDLGARYNGFSLSEQSPSVAAAIERVGQAADNSYIATEELSSSLGASFAEPMRESAQFASVVRNVLRYRVLKRIQGELTRDELAKKKALLESLERSELEAQRIERYLTKTGPPPSRQQRSSSESPTTSNAEQGGEARRASLEDTASIDSDFPPTHGETPRPSASQGLPHRSQDSTNSSGHRKSSSGNFVTNKIFGRISHAVHGFVDVDPERTRRDQIGKTKESLQQLEQALQVSEQDVKDATSGVMKDLKRFQREKEADLRRYMVAYAQCHLDWARKSLETWTEAKEELTFTTPSSKRRKVAAELRRAGERNGFHFPISHHLSKRPRIVKRYGHSSSPALLQPTGFYPPETDITRSPSSSIRVSPSRSPAESASDSPTSADQSSTESWSSLAATGSPTAITHDPVEGGNSSKQMSSSRNPSPAKEGASHGATKRPAAEMGTDENGSQDIVMKPDSEDHSFGGVATASYSDKKSNDGQTRHQRAVSVDMIGGEGISESRNKNKHDSGESTGSSLDSSTLSTKASSTDESKLQEHSSSAKIPSIDEQIAEVQNLMMQTIKDKQKGYIVSTTWLKLVLSCTTITDLDNPDVTVASSQIGPVDNSDLVLVTDSDASFKDEAGYPFVPLRPGLQLGEDFEVLPEEAWNRVMEWYGLAKTSPAIIRYAHNTNTEGDTEHIQYEIYPPVFTILKLSGPGTTSTPKDKSCPPAKLLASRNTPFQQWLRNAKEATSIDLSTKVRVWRILEGLSSSGNVTPDASRSVSPAPGTTVTAKIPTSLLLDSNTFVTLAEGSQRELVDAKDQTSNQKYNGKSSLHVAGLGSDNVIVLEEQIGGPAGGEWVSDTSKLGASRSGSKASANNRLKPKTITSSGRTSPVPTVITRGRRRKDGRTRGVTGLSNLGNTCYMNSALQCLKNVEELTHYFLQNEYKQELNPNNPLSHNGDVARAYASLLHQMYDEQGAASFAPRNFKNVIGRYGPSFSGYGQQDSQEFLLFLLDGLQEDLNRIKTKPYIEKPDSTDEMVHDKIALRSFADRCWEIYKARNDSVITDLFSGMYKSTVVCPECDKVSIIFDPFNNLTLQLPIDNMWSHTIIFHPLHGKPVLLNIDIDKNSGIKSIKEFVGRKMSVDPQRLVVAEVMNSRFFSLFDHSKSIADYQITDKDEIAVYELECVPTSFNPDKPGYAGYGNARNYNADDFDGFKGDRMMVPIFNRVPTTKQGSRAEQRIFFGLPTYAIITREEAYDYDAVLCKILSQVATLTTLDIFQDDEGDSVRSNSAEDSDTVITNEEDTHPDPMVKAASIESDDELVDVSMRENGEPSFKEEGSQDESAKPSNPSSFLKPGSFIPPKLQCLFDVKIAKTGSPGMGVYSSVSEMQEYQSMLARVQPKAGKKIAAQRMQRNAAALRQAENSPVSSEDELTSMSNLRSLTDAPGPTITSSFASNDNSESGSDSDTPMTAPSRLSNAQRRKQMRLQRQTLRKLPYIRPGETIILDWNPQAHDALFGEKIPQQNSLRGSPTWTNMHVLADPEIETKRRHRSNKVRNGISLAECLDEFGREEILSENDAWYCPRCKEHRRASKKFELWKVPDILVMHLKRFSANRLYKNKIEALVDFPQELDMTGRVQMPDEGKSMIYDLIAVDNHYGGMGGGHYTAYGKNFIDGSWYDYNDSHVSMSKPSSVVTKAAYLLFYRRRTDAPLGGEYLASLTAAAHNQAPVDSDSSRSSSPSGEGKRLDGSSRRGSSSALAGVGAAHQAGDGGSQPEAQTRSERPPAYTSYPGSGELSLPNDDHIMGGDSEDEGYGGGSYSTSVAIFSQPQWSYSQLDNHDASDSPNVPPGSCYGDNEAFDMDDDAASTKAQRSDCDLSDFGNDADDTGMVFSNAPDCGDIYEDSPPVIELQINDEELH